MPNSDPINPYTTDRYGNFNQDMSLLQPPTIGQQTLHYGSTQLQNTPGHRANSLFLRTLCGSNKVTSRWVTSDFPKLPCHRVKHHLSCLHAEYCARKIDGSRENWIQNSVWELSSKFKFRAERPARSVSAYGGCFRRTAKKISLHYCNCDTIHHQSLRYNRNHHAFEIFIDITVYLLHQLLSALTNQPSNAKSCTSCPRQ